MPKRLSGRGASRHPNVISREPVAGVGCGPGNHSGSDPKQTFSRFVLSIRALDMRTRRRGEGEKWIYHYLRRCDGAVDLCGILVKLAPEKCVLMRQ
jgi:hypothetical protein